MVKNQRTRYESNLGAVSMIRQAGLPYNNNFVITIHHFRNEKETGPNWLSQRLLGLLWGQGKEISQ